MSLLLDLILLLIAGVTIFLAAKRGFVKTLLSTASTLVALVIVFLFTSPLTDLLESTALPDAVRTNTASVIDSLVEQQGAEDSQSLALDRESELYTLLEGIGIDSESLSNWVTEHETMVKEEFRDELVAFVADSVTPMLLSAISVAILFFGSYIALKLLSFLLTGVVEKIPFVRGANHMLGVVLGVVLALIRILIFCTVVRVLLNTSLLSGLGALAGIDPDKTLLFRLFGNIPFIRMFF